MHEDPHDNQATTTSTPSHRYDGSAEGQPSPAQRVEIERMAYGGDGVGHLEDGRTVFVAGGVAGDVADVRVTHMAERYARATIDQVVTPSPDRVAPTCPHFGTCGGCPWQQLRYESQLAWKRQAVIDGLQRNGHLPADFAEAVTQECIPSPRQWGYRNKVEMDVVHAIAGGHERLALGMHATGSDEAVPVTECHLLPKRLVKAPKQLTGALRFAVGDMCDDLGIERVGIRYSEATRQRQVALWTKPQAFPRARVAKIVSDAIHATSVVRVLVKDKARTRKVVGVEQLHGPATWAERIGDEEMRVSAPSFFQVNTAQAARLVELVLNWLDSSPDDVVCDLYCGAGTFTLPLARRAGEVVAIEQYGSSVRDLRHNLDDAGLDADVIGDDVARALPEAGEDADLAVVDPPRAGLSHQALERIAQLPVRRLAYVSCDPMTLGRDLGRLAGQDGPFELVRATPVDLFPQTYHVETVAFLRRSEA